MKKLLFILALAVAIPTLQTSCSTAPSARVVQVQTLKAVGQSAEAAVTLAAQLYHKDKLTGAQARQVIDFYDQKFQPAFRVAVAAVQANLESVASPDLISLASQISALVVQLQNKHP